MQISKIENIRVVTPIYKKHNPTRKYATSKINILPVGICGLSYINNEKLSNVQLDYIFKSNGFEKTQEGYKKNLSDNCKKFLKQKYGDIPSRYVERMYSTPMNDEKFAKFSEFLNSNNLTKLVRHDFDTPFVVFSTMDNYGTYDNFKRSDNIYFELVSNVVKNYPDLKTKNALDNYKDIGYISINSALRGNEKFNNELKNDVNLISDYIETQKITKPLKVYRGETVEGLKNIVNKNGEKVDILSMMSEAKFNPDEMKKLKEFICDNEISSLQEAFLSTTLNKNLAISYVDTEYFTPENSHVIWELDTKSGTKGVFAEAFNITGMNVGEKEILFQKGSKFTLKDIDYDRNREIWFIKGEIKN